MARKVKDLLSRVRVTLQDTEAVRYLTPELLGYMNDAVLEARSIRPDLFVRDFNGSFNDVTDPEAAFPLPDQFFPAVCHYVCGRAELRDDEFAVDGRAMTLLAAFSKKLVGGI